MSAAKRLGSVHGDGAPSIERSPSSGIRLRVLPEDDRSSLEAFEAPANVRTAAADRARVSFYSEGDLAPEDAVPFSGNTAITAVFAFCATAAGALVAAGFYL